MLAVGCSNSRNGAATPTVGPEPTRAVGSLTPEPGQGPALEFAQQTLTLASVGDEARVAITAGGLAIGFVDTLQVQLRYDASVIAVDAPRCEGIYEGGFVTPVVRLEGSVSAACALPGGPTGSEGPVMSLNVRRIGPGDAELELMSDGAFGTTFIRSGIAVNTRFSSVLTVTGN